MNARLLASLLVWLQFGEAIVEAPYCVSFQATNKFFSMNETVAVVLMDFQPTFLGLVVDCRQRQRQSAV